MLELTVDVSGGLSTHCSVKRRTLVDPRSCLRSFMISLTKRQTTSDQPQLPRTRPSHDTTTPVSLPLRLSQLTLYFVSFSRHQPNNVTLIQCQHGSLKKCAVLLAPYITSIVNVSLSTGIFPHSWIHAVVTPLLKKAGLDNTTPSNFRPVSNLSFMSKVLERVWYINNYQAICQSTIYFQRSSLLTGSIILPKRHS